MSSLPNFLTDTEPRKWNRAELAAPAMAVVAREGQVTPRAWFTAANGLGLALALGGDRGSAAQLMEASIDLANRQARKDADGIQFGVESWVNRIGLLRVDAEAEAIPAWRSCYDLVLGRPVPKSHVFGLTIGRINFASPTVARGALAIVRNRSQVALLKLYLGSRDPERAVLFAREVIADFPLTVRAGMLQPIEVLANFAPRDPLLQHFDVTTPRTEGDFLVLLKAMQRLPNPAAASRMARGADFDEALHRFERVHTFRNPRTPLLWSVHHAIESGHQGENLRRKVDEALDACRRGGDRHMHRRIGAMATDRFRFSPRPAPPWPEPAEPPMQHLPRLAADLVAAAESGMTDVRAEERITG